MVIVDLPVPAGCTVASADFAKLIESNRLSSRGKTEPPLLFFFLKSPSGTTQSEIFAKIAATLLDTKQTDLFYLSKRGIMVTRR